MSTGSSSGALWRPGQSSPSSLLPRSPTSTRISNRSLVCFPFVLLLICSNRVLQLIWFRTKVYLQTNFLFKHRLAPNLLLVRKKDMVSIELGNRLMPSLQEVLPSRQILIPSPSTSSVHSQDAGSTGLAQSYDKQHLCEWTQKTFKYELANPK